MDSGKVYTLGKPNTFSNIERLSIFTTLTPSPSTPPPSHRLLRHLAIIPLPDLDGPPLITILTHTLRSLCAGGAELGAESISSVVESTVSVFLQVREVLCSSQLLLPGRQHYLFSLTHIQSAYQVTYSYTYPALYTLQWNHSIHSSVIDCVARSLIILYCCVLQGLYYCLGSGADLGVGLSWWHEMMLSLGSPLCHSEDLNWLSSLIHNQAEKV